MDSQNSNSNDRQLKALKVLIDGVKMAQKRGAYELPEAELLWNAIKVFLVNENENVNSLPENKEGDGLNIGFQNELINN